MARVLIKNWSRLSGQEPEWFHEMTFKISGESAGETEDQVTVMLQDNAGAAAIKNAISDAIRDLAISKYETTIANNQIIWPDCTRT